MEAHYYLKANEVPQPTPWGYYQRRQEFLLNLFEDKTIYQEKKIEDVWVILRLTNNTKPDVPHYPNCAVMGEEAYRNYKKYQSRKKL